LTSSSNQGNFTRTFSHHFAIIVVVTPLGVNEVNRNILVTSGKEIKRDFMISVNENRTA
jgi:hypothetical protein